jgi:hypothetical protein
MVTRCVYSRLGAAIPVTLARLVSRAASASSADDASTLTVLYTIDASTFAALSTTIHHLRHASPACPQVHLSGLHAPVCGRCVLGPAHRHPPPRVLCTHACAIDFPAARRALGTTLLAGSEESGIALSSRLQAWPSVGSGVQVQLFGSASHTVAVLLVD